MVFLPKPAHLFRVHSRYPPVSDSGCYFIWKIFSSPLFKTSDFLKIIEFLVNFTFRADFQIVRPGARWYTCQKNQTPAICLAGALADRWPIMETDYEVLEKHLHPAGICRSRD